MTLFFEDFKLDLITILLTICTTIYLYFQWSFQYWKKRNVPYLEPSIPFGTQTPPYKKTLNDVLADQYKYIKAKGWKYCGMYFSAKPILFIADLDLLKHVLTKDFNHFSERGLYVNEEHENITGNMFALGGPKWKRIRKELTPAFSSGKMKQMYQLIEDCNVVLETCVKELVNEKAPIDIRQITACYTTDVIGSCAFGLECNSFKDQDQPFVTYGRKVIETNQWIILKQNFANNFQKLARHLKVRFAPKDCYDFYNDIVKKTVSYREKSGVRRNDLMQMLIDIKNRKEPGLTLDEVIAQCFIFFIAGFETSSTTMTYAMFELTQHPDIQEKVREEVRTVLKKYDNKITYDSLKDMKYLEQVVEETLRMHTPLGFLTRQCTKDYKLPNSDLTIEKGTMIALSIKGIHFDEEYYENPNEFNPDRFSEENTQNRNQYTFMPFGEGPRICVGLRFAILQVKLGLVTLLKNYRVTLNEKTTLPLAMSTKAPFISIPETIWLNIEKV